MIASTCLQIKFAEETQNQLAQSVYMNADFRHVTGY